MRQRGGGDGERRRRQLRSRFGGAERVRFHGERPVIPVVVDVVLSLQRHAVFVPRRVDGHHVAADGVPPLPRLAVSGRHAHHRVVRGVSVDRDDAPTAGDAPRVAPRAAVSIGGDPVVRRLGAVGPAAGGGAAF